MSYNISCVKVANINGLSVDFEGFDRASEILGRDWHKTVQCLEQACNNGFMWTGEYVKEDELVEAIKCFKGEADFIVVWECGDSMTGLKLKDGVVSSHKVGFVLLD